MSYNVKILVFLLKPINYFKWNVEDGHSVIYKFGLLWKKVSDLKNVILLLHKNGNPFFTINN